MAKLTKPEAKAHEAACEILAKDVLTDEDKEFVQLNWQESANHVNSAAGAFFTPPGLAGDTVMEIRYAHRVIDLCAGIGSLALALWQYQTYDRADGADPLDIVCVELNPDYVAIGKKMLPEATWITGSIFDLPDDIGHFEAAMSNPPFGNIKSVGAKSKYTGSKFEYHTIAAAAEIAEYGVFIIPQQSSGFRYSGAPYYERQESREYIKFETQTGIRLEAGCGVDTSIYRDEWHGVSPQVEIVCTEFTRENRISWGSEDALF
jgi:hypothetical protein